MMFAVLVFFILGIVLWFVYDGVTGQSLPPGPRRIPILGSLSLYQSGFRKEQPYTTFKNLCKKYGSVVTIKFGLTWQVIVSDPEIMKEILTSDDYLNRPDNPTLNKNELNETGGILFQTGEKWRELRRFSIRTLRDFGFGKQKSQEVIMEEEMKELISELNETLQVSNVVKMEQFFTISVLNILWSMMSGIRFSSKDNQIQELLSKISILVGTLSLGGNLMVGFPFLRYFFYIFPIGTWGVRLSAQKALRENFNTILKERRNLGFYKDEQKDFIDVFLTQIDKEQGQTDPYFTDKEFVRVVMDFFVAGSETTANTCEFGILYMMLHPDVQKKVQAEIDQVVGRSRFPTATDRSMMPYTVATIHEIQRMANVVPMIPRAPTKDVQIGQYKVKKGMFMVLDIYSVHTNPAIWDSPEEFRPERFLEPETNRIINTDNLLVFGAGKRICPGEILASATLFTYFATMLQNYTFEIDQSQPLPSPVPRFGLTMTPQPYSALIKQRPF